MFSEFLQILWKATACITQAMTSEMFITSLSRTASTRPHKTVMKTTIVFLFLFGMFHFVRQGGWNCS